MIPLRQLCVLLALSMMAAGCGRDGTSAPGAGLARSDAARAAADTATAPAVAAVNHFGFDLLTSYLARRKGNVVVLPWSIASALAMARAGAKGDTATEMDQVLQIVDPASIDAAMNALGLALDADNGTFAR